MKNELQPSFTSLVSHKQDKGTYICLNSHYESETELIEVEEVLRVVPGKIKAFLSGFSAESWASLEEIRLRVGKPAEAVHTDSRFRAEHTAPVFQEGDATMMMALLSQHSVYRLEEELRRGYITIPGGHRVGIAGRVVVEKGHVRGLREIGSFNIRIAKDKNGVSDPYISSIYRAGCWTSTLIIGPPKTGKTTLLRDLARHISSGISRRNIRARNTAVIDERSEIAGCIHGIPQHQFGPKIDVLDGCPKAEGMMMMIRSMSPDVLIVDEIGREDDVTALMEAVHAGVTVMCSVHGTSVDDVKRRPAIGRLLNENAFEGVIELKGIGRKGIYRLLTSGPVRPEFERARL